MERYDVTIRREVEKNDAAFVGKPFNLVGENAYAVQANTRHMAKILLDSTARDRASRAAAFAADLLQVSIAHHLKEQIACARGCFHCCTTYVSTSLPEVFRLARGVYGNGATSLRVYAAAAKSKAMPQGQREIDRVHCPILVDGACSEYDVRPLVCRAVLSTSLESCLRIFQQGSTETFQTPPSLGALRSYLVVMLRAALVIAKLPYQNFELTHALEIALSTPNAEERWLAGEELFAAVALDQLDLRPSPITGLVDGLANAVRPTI